MRDAPCFACGCEHVVERLREDLRDSEEPSGDLVGGIGRVETPNARAGGSGVFKVGGGCKGCEHVMLTKRRLGKRRGCLVAQRRIHMWRVRGHGHRPLSRLRMFRFVFACQATLLFFPGIQVTHCALRLYISGEATGLS
jgi:hypothetical protein